MIHLKLRQAGERAKQGAGRSAVA